LEGWEKLVTDLEEKDRVRRKENILNERIANPELLTAFTLKRLDGSSISSEEMRGKVIAINFWGVWCHWCVKEMPEYQQLSDKYVKDKDVLILTINNDGDNDMVTKWMKDKKYNFAVLIDDNYNSSVDVNSYPTTFFVDRQGHIAFIKIGWSAKLLEEFSWRIETLK
jgi:thiol-disulfide isomerase/thioredoxin